MRRPRIHRALLLAGALLVPIAACGDEVPGTTAPESTTTSTVAVADTTTTSSTTTGTNTTSTPTTSTPTTSTPTTTTADVASTSVSPTVEPTTTESARTVAVRTYFLRGEHLVVEGHDVVVPAVLAGAVAALLEGPDDPDLVTAIPDGTRLLGVDLDDGTATIDLTGEFESGGGTLSMTARLGQLVFTATQFDNVDAVLVHLDGRAVEYLGGEGIVVSDPWTRADVARELTGGFIVYTPAPGDSVTSPFEVTGEADVFEGDFPLEVRRDGTTVLTVAPVRAGAWGEWADFSVLVELDIEPGPIELLLRDEGGCGDDPECPPVVETVIPLVLR